jgi:hypothetical protein
MRPKSERLVDETEANAFDNLRVRWRKFAEMDVVGIGLEGTAKVDGLGASGMVMPDFFRRIACGGSETGRGRGLASTSISIAGVEFRCGI